MGKENNFIPFPTPWELRYILYMKNATTRLDILADAQDFTKILSLPGFETESTLNVALGMGTDGPTYFDLSTAPHTLIAGQTGSGKSVCLNTLISSLILTKTPEELRLVLIDPKQVEFAPYEDAPHLLYPVLTEVESVMNALGWIVEEMESRFSTLAGAKVRNIKAYNAKTEKKMPSIVVVIDEYGDLMYMSKKKIEMPVIRLAQKARAVGIHLVIATQRPSVNVITGILKANVPTRIAFKVSSQIDARTIMDNAGAENLKGRGDMYFKGNESGDVVRLQGCYLSDEEIESIVNLSVCEATKDYSRNSIFA